MTSTNKIINLPELSLLLNISIPTIWRLRKANKFPHPIQLTERLIGWRIIEIERWLDAKSKNQNILDNTK